MQTKHLCVLIHIWTKDEVETGFNPPVKYFLLTVPRWCFFYGSFFFFFMFRVCHVFLSVHCLFIAALWPPAGKGLTSWLSCV